MSLKGGRKNFFKILFVISEKSSQLVSEGKNLTNLEYTFNRYIKKYEPSSPVAKAYAEFAKEVSADGRKKERLHSTDAR